MKNMKEVMAAVDAALSKVDNWQRDTRETQFGADQHAARAWTGTANGWHFVVVDFEIESQGFPKGTRGWDGAANHHLEKRIVYHMTREQAKTGVEAALKKTGGELMGAYKVFDSEGNYLRGLDGDNLDTAIRNASGQCMTWPDWERAQIRYEWNGIGVQVESIPIVFVERIGLLGKFRIRISLAEAAWVTCDTDVEPK